MIESKFIKAWQEYSPWPLQWQVEQDLIISRVLCELFSEPKIQSSLAFRGGTSLQKLFLPEPTRYSEDIDLVQIPKESIGETIDLIKSKLDPWLKKPQIDFKTGRVTIRYKYTSEIEPVEIMKLKIETNNAEHFSVMGYKKIPFKVQSEWFNGQCEITTFHLEEIMGTKLRALYQRKKGRDLYDFAQVLTQHPKIDCQKIVACFLAYLKHEKKKVSRAEFEKSLISKKNDNLFLNDIQPLLAEEWSTLKTEEAFQILHEKVISQIPGDPYKG